MKRYLKSFLSDSRLPDASFDLRDFKDKDFRAPVRQHEIGTKYTYPNGKRSPIIYIGMSKDLLRRLKDEHFTKGLKRLLDDSEWGLDKNWQLTSRYQYMYYNGSHVDVFKRRGPQDAKNLESIVLNRFYQTYRALPVGNGARSFGR